MSDPTATLARRAVKLSAALNQFRNANHDVVWTPLVATWVDTLGECQNPDCAEQADLRHSLLVNGEILTVLVCYDCGVQVALDTGMIRHASEFAVVRP